ncbi:hypothetical protein JCM11641_005492 [Rhodosporidiobolus odoratus]
MPLAKKQSTAKAKSTPLPVVSKASLPPAIRTLIYDKLDPLQTEDFRAMLALCRISKADCAVARPLLYQLAICYDKREDIYQRRLSGVRRSREEPLTEESDEEGYGSDESDDGSPAYGMTNTVDTSAKKMLLSLEKYLHLQPLVTKFSFYGKFETYGALVILQRFLKICPNLSDIRLVAMKGGSINQDKYGEYDDGFPAIKTIIEHEQQIKSLFIRRISPMGSLEPLAALPKLSKLERFSFHIDRDDCWADVSSGSRPDTPASPLTTLNLNTVVEPKLFKSLTSTSLTSLTTLTICIRQFNRINILSQTLDTAPPSLLSLDLRRNASLDVHDDLEDRWSSDDPDYDSDDDDRYDSSEDAESKKARMERKKVKNAKATKEAKESTFSYLLSHTPTALDRLSFSYYLDPLALVYWAGVKNQESDALLAALDSTEFCPVLRILDVADRAEEDRIVGSDYPERRKEDKEEWAQIRRKLEKACEKRGVWLSDRTEGWWEAIEQEGKIQRVFPA